MATEDPTTREGWASLHLEANRRMRDALAKIDHERRADLIDRKIRGLNMTREERDELEALQKACDDAMAEEGDVLRRFQEWKYRQIGGDALVEELRRLEAEEFPDAQA